MTKGAAAITHFKQIDLNAINNKLQRVTFDIWRMVSRKQFNIVAENMFYSG